MCLLFSTELVAILFTFSEEVKAIEIMMRFTFFLTDLFSFKYYSITFLLLWFALYFKAKLIPEQKVDVRVTCLLNSM